MRIRPENAVFRTLEITILGVLVGCVTWLMYLSTGIVLASK